MKEGTQRVVFWAALALVIACLSAAFNDVARMWIAYTAAAYAAGYLAALPLWRRLCGEWRKDVFKLSFMSWGSFLAYVGIKNFKM